ncbi:MAG: PTS ascorbate transporter subunit IIC [Mycoplasmoidaceae bacterium]
MTEIILRAGTDISIPAGEWFLTFFRDFVATPAILVGLFAMLGTILLRKKGTDIITSFFKTAAGFLIIAGGAGMLVGSLRNFQVLFEDLFGISGIVPNNDAFAGWFFDAFPAIAQLGSIIMVISMVLNLVLAYASRFKYVFLSGHVLFYMSVMLAGVMSLSGFDLSNPADYSVALIGSALLMSCYMVLSCAMTYPWAKKITGQDNITVAHTGSLSYAMGGLIGDLVYKIKKGENIKSTEAFNFPRGLQFFRNTFISMSITMLIVFLIVYVPEGIMYNLGIKLAEGPYAESILRIFGPDAAVNWLVQCIIDAFTFAAGVEVMLLGVRMVVGELVPAFKGISEKLIKNAKAGIDCPIVFPYAPNAVLIGFIASIVGALVGLGISIGITSADTAIPVILPGIVAQFFLGATTGVFGNVKGGIWGCLAGAFANGLIITMVPIIFYVGGWVPNDATLGWGDTDFILGVIPGLLTLPNDQVISRVLIITIPALIFSGLVIDGLIKRFVLDKRKPKINSQEKNA